MNNFTLLMAFLSISFFSHDIQVATFTVSQTADKIHLLVKIDANDLAKELGVSATSHSLELIEQFINDQTVFKFDNQVKLSKVQSIATHEDHLIITAVFEEVSGTVHNVDILNTCLLSIDNHSNIIQLRLNDQERDFLMNSKRTNINVQY